MQDSGEEAPPGWSSEGWVGTLVTKSWIVAQVRERTSWLVGSDPDLDSKNESPKHQQLAMAIKAAIAEKVPYPDCIKEEDAIAAVELAVTFVKASVHRWVGGPEHSAKEWYKAWYRVEGGRRGLSMEEVRALLKQKSNPAPDPKTIRKWENEVEGE